MMVLAFMWLKVVSKWEEISIKVLKMEKNAKDVEREVNIIQEAKKKTSGCISEEQEYLI